MVEVCGEGFSRWVCEAIRSVYSDDGRLTSSSFLASLFVQEPKIKELFLFHDKLSEALKLLNSSSNCNKQLLTEELLMDWLYLTR